MLSLLRLIIPHTAKFLLALLALFVGSAITLALPKILQFILGPYLHEFLNRPFFIGLCLAILFVIQGIAFYIRQSNFYLIGQQVAQDLRIKLFKSILDWEIEQIEQENSTELGARLSGDIAAIYDAVSVRLSVVIRYGIQTLVGSIFMGFISINLTIFSIVAISVVVGITALSVRRLKNYSKSEQGAVAKVVSFGSEIFGGFKVVRSFGAESYVAGKFSDLVSLAYTGGCQRVRFSAFFSSFANLLLSLAVLAGAIYGAILVSSQTISVTDLVTFIFYGAIVAVSLGFLMTGYTELSQGITGLERIDSLLKKTSQKKNRITNQITLNGDEAIKFSHVAFSYKDSPTLIDVNFVMRKGATAAIVGPSGCGKSTVVSLILGFRDPQSGEIAINDESIALVSQDPIIFSLSIKENLQIAKADASEHEIGSILSLVGLEEIISNFEGTVNSDIGERGASLSGGQKQRLAIARALLKEPKILILDEATSALDSKSEQEIYLNIRKRWPKMTLILISHRMASIKLAERVIVIENGRLVQDGKFEDLMESVGPFKEYLERQVIQDLET